VPDALRGYKEIHLRALKLLKPGGTLATFCCSHHVGAELFQDSLLSAAYDTRHILRRVATYAQSPDHPIISKISETEFPKGVAFESEGRAAFAQSCHAANHFNSSRCQFISST
jgi:23S rRNA (cytosine1962-C5)-methyltransferase